MYGTFSCYCLSSLGKQSVFEKFPNHFTWVIITFELRMDDGNQPLLQEHYTESII